jgi:hypothetical protein
MVGYAIMGIFIITMIPATLFFVWARQGRLGRWQAKCIKELKKADPDDGEEYDKTVGQVFHAFDVDESGELDTDELRDLFVALHPKISRDDLSSCIRCMSTYVDPASGVLTEPKFLDALIEGERTLSQRIKERNTGPKVPMLRMKTRDLGQFQEDPMAIADDEREKVLEEDVIRRHRKIGTPDTDASPLVTMPQRAEVGTVSSTSTNSLGGADRSHIAQFAKGDKVLYTPKAVGPQIRAEISRLRAQIAMGASATLSAAPRWKGAAACCSSAGPSRKPSSNTSARSAPIGRASGQSLASGGAKPTATATAAAWKTSRGSAGS